MQLFPHKPRNQIIAAREYPVSRYVPISHLNTANIFETKNGAQGCVIAVKGCAFEVTDNDELNWNQKLLANLLLTLSDEFAVYVTTHRHRHTVYPRGDFAPGFAHDFNAAYQARFSEKQLYVNDIYITLMVKGPTGKAEKSFSWTQQLVNRSVKYSLSVFRQQQQTKLMRAVHNFIQSLAPFSPRLLGEIQTDLGKRSEVLALFFLLVNGHKQQISYPLGDIASYLPFSRISFGHNTLEWQGNTEQERRFAAIVSIKKYAPDSASVGLDSLLKLDLEYVNTHSFLLQKNELVLERIQRQAKHLFDANDASHSQQTQLLEAKDALGSGHIAFGHHHNTILVFAENQNTLEEKIALLSKCYRDADLTVVRESLNLESAFWAQLPGNFSHIRRSALISSDNFADFCSLHNYHHGYVDQNHLGSALMLVETASRTPLYINFHEPASGKQNDLSKGHTTIIAPSNAGKTTLMLAMDAQAKKYHGTSIFFDRNQGCEIYIRAMRGHYAVIQPGQSTGFNPLALGDTPSNRNFLVQWLSSLVSINGVQLSAKELKQIAEVVNRNYTLPFEKRTLSILASFFPADFAHLDALTPWLRSDGGRPDGRLAYLFDNPTDELNLQPNMLGFDMTHLLDHESPAVVFSVMLYLFHRIDQIADGKLMGIYLDEGWQFLDNPFWQEKLKAYLPTLRKNNVYLVFATQSPGTVANSSLRDELIQGSATNIFLPNPKAEAEHYMQGFKLTQREYDWVKQTDPLSRRFLFKQANTAAIGQLNLSGLEDYIAVFSGNKTTVALLDQVRKEVGDDPAVSLPIFHARRPQ